MGMAAPLMAEASSEVSQAMVAASWAGSTQREWSAVGMSRRLEGVSMTLGRTQLAVISPGCWCSSRARLSVRVTTPALLTAYAAAPAEGWTAARDETLMMRP